MRAFSISTICLAFITMCWLLIIIVREGCYIPATLLGFLTVRWRSLSLSLSSIIDGVVLLFFFCVRGYVHPPYRSCDLSLSILLSLLPFV